MVDQRLRPRHEILRPRQRGMGFERGFVRPTRMDVEEPRVAGGAKGVDGEAAGLLAHPPNLLAQHVGERILLAFAGVEAGEDEDVHAILPFAWPGPDAASADLARRAASFSSIFPGTAPGIGQTGASRHQPVTAAAKLTAENRSKPAISVDMEVPTRPGEDAGAARASTHPLGATPTPLGRGEVPAARPLFHPPSPKPKTARKLMRQHELVERVKTYDPDADEGLLDKAYVYAMTAHGKQFRASGDPYFTHPLEVAGILTELKLDVPTIVTALLHEDRKSTRLNSSHIPLSRM